MLRTVPTTLRWILTLYLLLGTFYAAATPMFEVSDEPLHAGFVQHLANGGSLPVQRPTVSMEQAPWQQEGSQPPLYYAVVAALLRPFDRADFTQIWRFNPHSRAGRADAFDNFNQMIHAPEPAQLSRSTLAFLSARVLGVCLGACAVAAAFFIAAMLSADQRMPVLAASLVAFNPMFVHIMASVNNDTLAVALSSLSLWLGATIIRDGIAPRRILLLGVLLGCASLTKVSGLVLVAVVPAAIVLARWRDLNMARLAAFAVLAGLPIVLIAGWWYLRNLQLYGDLTGTAMMALVAGPRPHSPAPFELLDEWSGFFKAYWGLFIAVNVPMSEWIYRLLETGLIVSGFGLLMKLRDRHYGPTSVSQRNIAALCAVTSAVAMIALIRWTLITYASQGRLLFPFIAALASLGALGLLRALQSIQLAKPVLRTIPAALATLTLAAHVIYIQPVFARPSMLADATQIPAGFTPVDLRYDDALRWIGYRVNTPGRRVGADHVLDVTLYLQSLRPLDRDYTLFVRVLARPVSQPLPMAYYRSVGGGGMLQTSAWTPGAVSVERIRIRLPDDFSLANQKPVLTTPSALAIDVGFIDRSDGHFLATRDGTGAPVGRPAPVIASTGPLPGSALNAPADYTLIARFDRADLIGATTTISGQQKSLVLTWRVTQDFSDDYNVFVHAYDDHTRVAQADGPAAAGDFPARWWRVGDVITDKHVANIPNGTDPAQVTFGVGLYRLEADFERMPCTDKDGKALPDFSVTVPANGF